MGGHMLGVCLMSVSPPRAWQMSKTRDLSSGTATTLPWPACNRSLAVVGAASGEGPRDGGRAAAPVAAPTTSADGTTRLDGAAFGEAERVAGGGRDVAGGGSTGAGTGATTGVGEAAGVGAGAGAGTTGAGAGGGGARAGAGGKGLLGGGRTGEDAVAAARDAGGAEGADKATSTANGAGTAAGVTIAAGKWKAMLAGAASAAAVRGASARTGGEVAVVGSRRDAVGTSAAGRASGPGCAGAGGAGEVGVTRLSAEGRTSGDERAVGLRIALHVATRSKFKKEHVCISEWSQLLRVEG